MPLMQKTAAKLRALIIDDEPLARDKIRLLLAADRDIEIIGECENGEDAVRTINRESPDLLFLDIQMPGIDGFGVLERLDLKHLPGIVFVTAYDEHAIRAFEVHAIDYILKPFAQKRFSEALQRAKDQLRKVPDASVNQQILSLLGDLKGGSPERIVVKVNGRVVFLKVADIDWVEAAGNYVSIHVGKDAYLLRETMNGIESHLSPKKFVRIHRSTLVNVDRIKELSPLFHGDYVLTLSNGTKLTMSRSYRGKLSGLVNGEF